MCGDGALVRHLESFGLRCVYAGDIPTGQDALDLTPADINGAPIITNPPFSQESQPLLRRLIAHFLRIAPVTWLLLPADFASNQWFAPFLPPCTDIVANRPRSLDRGHEWQGYENSAWYRFDTSHSAGPIFHATGAAPVIVARQPVRAMRQALSAAAIRFPVLLRHLPPARLPKQT